MHEAVSMKHQRTPSEMKLWVGLCLILAVFAGAGIARSDASSATLLTTWACAGDVDHFVSSLMNSDVNERDACGRTPLIRAAGSGFKEEYLLVTAQQLLARGADINAVDDYGWTALTHAAWVLDRTVMVKLLQDRGAEHTFMSAACLGDLDQVKHFLRRGALVNAKGPHGGATALMGAAREGHAEIVRLLISRGADVNAKLTGFGDDRNWNAILFAARGGHVDVAGLLLKKEADPNSKDKEDTTPLIWALRNAPRESKMDMVKLLLDHGARVNDMDEFDSSALGCAVGGGHADIVRLLLNRGAKLKPSWLDFLFGRGSLLIVAARNDRFEVAKVLLDFGVNVNEKDSHGDTALKIAQRRGNKAMETLLKRRGAKD